LRVIVVKIV